jgi:hypothetical protein
VEAGEAVADVLVRLVAEEAGGRTVGPRGAAVVVDDLETDLLVGGERAELAAAPLELLQALAVASAKSVMRTPQQPNTPRR